MTHNTREVEELKKEFIAEYKAGHKEGGMRSYLFTGQNGSLIADWWIEKLHHQLQKARGEDIHFRVTNYGTKKVDEMIAEAVHKARQDWLRQEIVKLEGMKRDCCAGIGPCNEICRATNEGNHTVQTIIDRYQVKLDQDKK